MGIIKENSLGEWEEIYAISFPKEKACQRLYFDNGSYIPDKGIQIKKGETIDLGTYFNCFSLAKWIDYTTLEKLSVRMTLLGKAEVEIYSISKEREETLWREETSGNFRQVLDLEQLKADGVELMGIKIHAGQEDICLQAGAYWGVFTHTQPVRIGINICTFKREEYVLRNLEVLKELINKNKDFNITIVDNGQSLPDITSENIQVFPNPNFGGSGGFTRGMMEQVNQGINTHILMMDDDIVIEPASLERVYKVYQHVKEERRQQMFGGAMLSIGNPTQQVENTAYWNRIRLVSNGAGFELTDKRRLYNNECFLKQPNTYAAWWFCCIPMEVVKKNGYPLPVFIKGDDMEYGIRNQQEIMHMNGVGVWHEAFAKKVSPAINYFSDRNMLILNHYATGCNRWTFLIAVFGRMIRHILSQDMVGVKNFELALRDYSGGFDEVTRIGADEKFAAVRNYKCNKSVLQVICSITNMGIGQFLNYNRIHNNYLSFRKEKLQDQTFWRHYLRLE